MSGQPTRAARLRPPARWAAWAAFVRRPALPARADPGPVPGLRAVLALFALDLAIMAALFAALGLALALGYAPPEHMLGELEFTPLLALAVVIGAPMGEETVFRGWLSGRPGHLLAVAALVLGGAVAALAGSGVIAGVALAAAAVAAPVQLWLFRTRPAIGWFRRRFAWFFWASALLFAAVHLTNFASAGLALLPLVLPQFALALLLGYLRVHHGLWSAMLLHMLHNATFVGLMSAGSGAG